MFSLLSVVKSINASLLHADSIRTYNSEFHTDFTGKFDRKQQLWKDSQKCLQTQADTIKLS